MRNLFKDLFGHLVRIISCSICFFLIPLALISYLIFPRRRHIARVNIDLCFPEMHFALRRILLIRIFFNFFYGAWECCLAWVLPISILKRLINDQTADEVTKEILNHKSCLLVCPHYSCLEMVAPALSLKLTNLVMSYRPHENKRIEKVLVSGRSRFGMLIDVKEIRLMIKALRGTARLWFGPDQDKGLNGSIFSTFFNVPASTVTTPARLARIVGAPLYFVRFRRKFLLYELKLERFPKDYPFEDEELNADIINQFVESAVSKDISQYMWFHRRFKTQPFSPRYSFYE